MAACQASPCCTLLASAAGSSKRPGPSGEVRGSCCSSPWAPLPAHSASPSSLPLAPPHALRSAPGSAARPGPPHCAGLSASASVVRVTWQAGELPRSRPPSACGGLGLAFPSAQPAAWLQRGPRGTEHPAARMQKASRSTHARGRSMRRGAVAGAASGVSEKSSRAEAGPRSQQEDFTAAAAEEEKGQREQAGVYSVQGQQGVSGEGSSVSSYLQSLSLLQEQLHLQQHQLHQQQQLQQQQQEQEQAQAAHGAPSEDFARLCREQLEACAVALRPGCSLTVYLRSPGSFLEDRMELQHVLTYSTSQAPEGMAAAAGAKEQWYPEAGGALSPPAATPGTGAGSTMEAQLHPQELDKGSLVVPLCKEVEGGQGAQQQPGSARSSSRGSEPLLVGLLLVDGGCTCQQGAAPPPVLLLEHLDSADPAALSWHLCRGEPRAAQGPQQEQTARHPGVPAGAVQATAGEEKGAGLREGCTESSQATSSPGRTDAPPLLAAPAEVLSLPAANSQPGSPASEREDPVRSSRAGVPGRPQLSTRMRMVRPVRGSSPATNGVPAVAQPREVAQATVLASAAGPVLPRLRLPSPPAQGVRGGAEGGSPGQALEPTVIRPGRATLAPPDSMGEVERGARSGGAGSSRPCSEGGSEPSALAQAGGAEGREAAARSPSSPGTEVPRLSQPQAAGEAAWQQSSAEQRGSEGGSPDARSRDGGWGRQWLSHEEELHVRRVAKTLTLACVLEQRSLFIQHSVHQHSRHLEALILQTREPLAVIRTLGALLVPQVSRTELGPDMVQGVMDAGAQLSEVLEDATRSVLCPPVLFSGAQPNSMGASDA